MLNFYKFTRILLNCIFIYTDTYIMSNIIHIRELLMKAHFGELTPSEQQELDALLTASEDARQLQDEINSLPRQEMLTKFSELHIDEGWQKVLEKESFRRRERTSYRRNWIIGSAVAASIVLGGVFLLPVINKPSVDLKNTTAAINDGTTGQATLQLANGKVIVLADSGQQVIPIGNSQLHNTNRILKMAFLAENQERSTGWSTIAVPRRMDYQVELSDGTVVWLNSTSKLRFPLSFQGKNREVYIDEGEAYFQVAQQAETPFIVHAKGTDIQVLGTEFNVNAYQAKKIVTSLVSGKVAIQTSKGRKELMPNQEAIVTNDAVGIMVQDFDLTTTTSWRQGIHYFRNAPVNDIALMLSRWFNVELIIDNQQVAKVQFRGRLDRNKPLSDFIEEMNLTKDATFYWKDGVLHCR